MSAAATSLRVSPLATNEIADNGGYTHIASVSYLNLTETSTNTAQTLKLCDLAAGDNVLKVAWRVKTYFTDASDAAFNSNTMSIGDTNAVDTFIAAVQVNSNGTEVRQGFTNTAHVYTAADALNVTFNSMSAKALNDIDAGEVEILFQLSRISVLEEAESAVSSSSRSLTYGTTKS
jgi:hypothetical protein